MDEDRKNADTAAESDVNIELDDSEIDSVQGGLTSSMPLVSNMPFTGTQPPTCTLVYNGPAPGVTTLEIKQDTAMGTCKKCGKSWRASDLKARGGLCAQCYGGRGKSEWI